MKQKWKLFRTLAALAGALVLLLVAGWLGASLKASAKLSRKHDAHRIELVVPNPLGADELAALRVERAAAMPEAEGADPLAGVDLNEVALERAVARGKHLVDARYGCKLCHGQDLAGGVMIEDAAIGQILGPNLTHGKGGLDPRFSMSDWDRSVRHGIKPDGTPSLMPSSDFFVMSDHELSDIVAYVCSVPAVDRAVAPPSFGPVGRLLLALGKFPLSAEQLPDHQRAHGRVAPGEDTPAFGAHLAATCTGCHRENLAGGAMAFGPPDWPAAANLTRTGLSGWSFEDFERALTQGISKNGHALREPMTHVLPGTRAMTSRERKALWHHLQAVPARPINL